MRRYWLGYSKPDGMGVLLKMGSSCGVGSRLAAAGLRIEKQDILCGLQLCDAAQVSSWCLSFLICYVKAARIE